MSENYQNSITDQICKVQTSKKLIALYDRLRYTSYNSYAQLHAKGGARKLRTAEKCRACSFST